MSGKLALARLRIRSSKRFVAARWVQWTLALSGSSLGVAAVVAVSLARSTVEEHFAQSLDAVFGATTHQIQADDGRIGVDQYQLLRALAADIAMAPVRELELTDGDGKGWTLLGVDLVREADFGRPGGSWGAGSPIRLSRWLMGEPLLLAGRDITVDAMELTVGGEPVAFELVSSGRSLPANTLIADLSLIARLTNSSDIERIDLILREGEIQPLEELFAEHDLLGGLGMNPTGQDSPQAGMGEAFTINLLGLSLLTTLVGGLIVYNAIHLFCLERQPVLAIEHRLGVSRSSIRRWLLVEGGLLGTAGCLIGIPAGIALSRLVLDLVTRTMGDLYVPIDLESTRMAPFWLGVAATIGLGSALLASWLATIESGQPQTGTTSSRRLVWSSLAAAAMGWLMLAVPGNLTTAMGGIFVLSIGYAMASTPVLARLGAAAMPWFPIGDKLMLGYSVRRLVRQLNMLLPAVTAMVLAVATVISIGTMVSSFRFSVDDWLTTSLSADYYLRPAGGDSITPEILRALDSLPGLTGYSRFQTELFRLHDEEVELSFIDPDDQALDSYGDFDSAFWQRFVAEPRALVSEGLARRNGWQTGDLIPTDPPIVIAAVVRDYRTGTGRIAVHWAHRSTFGRGNEPTSVGLYLDRDLMTEALPAIAAQYGLEYFSSTDIRQQTLVIFDQTFVLTQLLKWTAAIIAVLGLIGGLAALQWHRTDEFRLLRELGTTRRQLRISQWLESGVFGLLVALIAMPLSGLLVWALLKVINPRAFGWIIEFHLEPSSWLLGAAVALVGSALAGLLVSRA